jgi:hypothetical protein
VVAYVRLARQADAITSEALVDGYWAGTARPIMIEWILIGVGVPLKVQRAVVL